MKLNTQNITYCVYGPPFTLPSSLHITPSLHITAPFFPSPHLPSHHHAPSLHITTLPLFTSSSSPSLQVTPPLTFTSPSPSLHINTPLHTTTIHALHVHKIATLLHSYIVIVCSQGMKQIPQVGKCESGINLGIYLTLPDIVHPA